MLVRTLVGIFTLVGALESFAQVECSVLSQSYGEADIHIAKTIKRECYQQAVSSTSNSSHKFAVSVDQSLRVIAYKRILFITKFHEGKELDTNIIAGSMASIDMIKSVSISHDNKSIAILNQELNGNKSIQVYSTQLYGNVSPQKINRDDKLINSHFILFNSNNDIVVSLNSDGNESLMIKYSRNSDSRSPHNSVKPQALTVLSDRADNNFVDSLVVDNSFYLLKGNGKIYRYDDTNSLVDVFAIDTSFIGKRLFYDQKSHAIVVINESDDFKSLSLK